MTDPKEIACICMGQLAQIGPVEPRQDLLHSSDILFKHSCRTVSFYSDFSPIWFPIWDKVGISSDLLLRRLPTSLWSLFE